jgi:hypothetical protein
MTEPGDRLAARYRELAREEPPAALDAAILKAARAETALPRRSSSWMGPVSIAAVLVLGIGVSLRMQMEKPGIETSVASSSPAEYPAPAAEAQPSAAGRVDSAAKKDAAPAAAPEQKPPPPARQMQVPPGPKVLRKQSAPTSAPAEEAARNVAREPEPNPFTDAPVTMQAPVPVSPPVTALSAANAPPPPAAPATLAKPAPSGAAVATPPLSAAAPPPGAAAPAPAQAPQALRAKREGAAADAAAGGAREMRRATAEPDPDPVRELERIAALRAAGNHAEADRAIEQFRRRHPDFPHSRSDVGAGEAALVSEIRRVARALIERRSERVESRHPLAESQARLGAALEHARLQGATVFTPTWHTGDGRAVLEAAYAPTARVQRLLPVLSMGMAFALAASVWAIATQEGTIAFMIPLLTVFATLALPFVALGLGSQRAAEEARIAKAIRVALLDEEERLPAPQRWKDED